MRKFHDWLQGKIFDDSYPKIVDVEIFESLQIEDLNDGKRWKTLRALNGRIKIQRSKNEIAKWEFFRIEIGFITDLASVDGIPFVKIDKLTIGNRWYVLHDYGFQKNMLGLTQKNWDTIMLMGLKKDGASSGLSWRRWIGVQLGGRRTWKKYRNR